VPPVDRPPRLAVVHCPQWPVAVAGALPGESVAVLHANRVIARSGAAAEAGVRIGQRRREAQSRCPSLRLVVHEPARDARAFHEVTTAVAELVPRLEVTAPGLLTFPTRGPSRYFGGDQLLAERLQQLVQRTLGSRATACGPPTVGIADGRFAAGVAARLAVRAAADPTAPVRVVEPGGSPAMLAPLPLRWLADVGEVPMELIGLLRRLGLVVLADLAALPAADVLARFGLPGVIAHRMAAGGDDRLPGTEDPPEGLVLLRHFDTPVHQVDTLAFVGRQLAEELFEALAGTGRVCTQLLVTAETEHGERTERCWSRSTGLSSSAMVERIRWQLDGWVHHPVLADGAPPPPSSSPSSTAGEPITAGVVLLRIEPLEVRADEGVQLGLWGGRTQADEWAQRATARLVGLVGDEQVVVPAWQGGRTPEQVYRWVPASLSDLAEPADRLQPAVPGPWPGTLPSPSPSLVFPAPLEAAVCDVDGRPVSVSGRGLPSAAPARIVRRGATEVVAAWAGPWPVEERWWDAGRHRRLARFQLLTEAGRAYLAVIERQQWWLVAEYA
jgi:protein ImuB